MAEKFYEIFIKDQRYELFFEGLANTLIITLGAALIGLVLGVLIAMIKVAATKYRGFRIPAVICDVYVTIIRGTPVVLQLFILSLAVFVGGIPEIIPAVLTFGINSSAYVSENIRACVLSVDRGQAEAGQSLGLTYGQTLRYIILPQSFKTAIPSVCNEVIALLKETSVISVIGMTDISQFAKVVGGRIADYLTPMLCIAVVYLVFVYGLTLLVKLIERRLRRND
jgi:amino ABC transporter, permease protein, 3-TM region, his/glu/gln/arg/opine family